MKFFIRCRPFSYFLNRNYYCWNRVDVVDVNFTSIYKDYWFICDIGAITIGMRKDVNKVDKHVWYPVLKKPIRTPRMALRYIIPHRLTLKYNPRIHAWLWWNF